MSKPKATHPWYQDWFNRDYLLLYAHRSQEEAEQQVSFIISALNLKGNEKILDLGCGAGRHAIALGQRGFSVVGVDASQTLLNEANKQLKLLGNQQLNKKLTFLCADFFSLGSLGSFDVVINMFTSFGYSDVDETNARLFSVVRKNLKDGGLFFLDTLHPEGVKKNLVPHQQITLGAVHVTIDRKIVADQVIKTIRFPHKTYEEKVKLYSRDQLERMLGGAQLQVISCWNDFSGSLWSKKGDRQLFCCRAVD